METAKEHYAALLGGIYEWSVSASGDPFARATDWLARHHLDTGTTYLDLGAGFGAHTVPLARAGRSVVAVDFDAALLARLAEHLGPDARRVTVAQEDLVTYLAHSPHGAFSVILCLGDTLTHLPDVDAVRTLLRHAAQHLAEGGRLALSYRDHSLPAPQGLDRFIPVARDATRTMHCFLEAVDANHLRVTDIVTDIGADGPGTRMGAYVKLRLSPACVAAWAEECALALDHQDAQRGMITQVFRQN